MIQPADTIRDLARRSAREGKRLVCRLVEPGQEMVEVDRKTGERVGEWVRVYPNQRERGGEDV